MAKKPAAAAAPLDETLLSALRPDPNNRRKRTKRNREMIRASLTHVGAARSIVIDEDNIIRAGNGVAEEAPHVGITKLRIVDVDGDTIVAVRRRGLTDEQKRAMAIYDNRTAELSEWSGDQLAADALAGLDLKPFWTADELAAMTSNASADEVVRLSEQDRPAHTAAVSGGDFQTFSCPLTVEQERIVRAALREARRVYQKTTAGDALTAVLDAWMAQQKAAAS